MEALKRAVLNSLTKSFLNFLRSGFVGGRNKSFLNLLDFDSTGMSIEVSQNNNFGTIKISVDLRSINVCVSLVV